MEQVMRTLKIDELELVAGAEPGGGNSSKDKGNNGWGNGEDVSPGASGEKEPINPFDPVEGGTGPSPSGSPASGGGSR
jgi:hypothetical protein